MAALQGLGVLEALVLAGWVQSSLRRALHAKLVADLYSLVGTARPLLSAGGRLQDSLRGELVLALRPVVHSLGNCIFVAQGIYFLRRAVILQASVAPVLVHSSDREGVGLG